MHALPTAHEKLVKRWFSFTPLERMPASQLTQLKAALTTSGLNRKATSKKDNKAFKKGGARETDRAKTLQRLEDIRRGLNRFDERETKVFCNSTCSQSPLKRAGQAQCRWTKPQGGHWTTQ